MTEKQAWIVLLVIAIAGAIWWYAYGPKKASAELKPRVPSKEELRAKAGPYIATTKQLNDSEEISTLIVPSSYGEFLDVKCLIYKNREFKQVVMNCPGATQMDFDTIDRGE